MTGGRVLRRIGAIILTLAIFVAPFIALVFRTDAGLLVMALALTAGSFLLRGAIEVAPVAIHRWLRLGVLVNLLLALACVVLATWLLWQS